MTRTNIFIIHEHPERLDQAVLLLNANPGLRVVHAMRSVHECFARVGIANCDLILASANLPKDDLRKLLKHLRQQPSPAKVIVTDLPNDPKQILAYIAAGAAGYVLAQEGVSAWVKQIDAVSCGQPVVSPAMAAAMMRHLARLSLLAASVVPQPQLSPNLTKREHEVLTLLGEGHSNQVIAQRLILAVGTVKNHVHHILTKLKLNNRKAAGTYLAFVG
jgi:DNA-binding NarL/FixJ family response regulator